MPNPKEPITKARNVESTKGTQEIFSVFTPNYVLKIKSADGYQNRNKKKLCEAYSN